MRVFWSKCTPQMTPVVNFLLAKLAKLCMLLFRQFFFGQNHSLRCITTTIWAGVGPTMTYMQPVEIKATCNHKKKKKERPEIPKCRQTGRQVEQQKACLNEVSCDSRTKTLKTKVCCKQATKLTITAQGKSTNKKTKGITKARSSGNTGRNTRNTGDVGLTCGTQKR